MIDNPQLFEEHRYEGRVLARWTNVTLRDLFAGFALVGRCARDDGSTTEQADAAYCYAEADAMLDERAK